MISFVIQMLQRQRWELKLWNCEVLLDQGESHKTMKDQDKREARSTTQTRTMTSV